MHMVAAAAKVTRVKDARRKRFIVVPGEGSGRDWTQTSALPALGDDNISVLNVAKGTVLKPISRRWLRKAGDAKCLSLDAPAAPAIGIHACNLGTAGSGHPEHEKRGQALLFLSSWVGYVHEAREPPRNSRSPETRAGPLGVGDYDARSGSALR